MLNKDEYKKELVRMWDSVRTENKGILICRGILCSDCPMHYINNLLCERHLHEDDMYVPIECVADIMETVEKWSKEHPIITNRDKFKEVFGWEIPKNFQDCYAMQYCDCLDSNDCSECPYNGFWGKEYKEPKESEEE